MISLALLKQIANQQLKSASLGLPLLSAEIASVVLRRHVSTRGSDTSRVLQEFCSLRPPTVIPSNLTAGQAEAAFDAYHKQHFLSPSGLSAALSSPITQALLPFWIFEATAEVQYTGLLGFAADQKDLEWKSTHWRNQGTREFSPQNPAMQICASYSLRRDLVDVVKDPSLLACGRNLERQEAEAQEASAGVGGDAIPIQPPEMRQSIAWNLAVTTVKRLEAAEAERQLRSETGCAAVRDVQIRLKTLRRRVRLVYVPAFVIDYSYGEHFNAHGVRHPEQFQAVVSGLDGSVAAERHFSPQKVQLAAAFVMGAVSSAAAVVGLHGQTFLSPPTILAALMICMSAGLAARLSPLLVRQLEEERRIQTEDAEMEKILAQGLGPQDVLDDKHEEIRCSSEWRRWQEADKWAWDGRKRQKWAEALWRQQQVRRLQRREFEKNRARAEARHQAETEAEARRRAKWGHAGHHSRFSQSHAEGYSGVESGGGRPDFLGYYGLLGLDGSLRTSISAADIKRAFREAALRWHPDRVQAGDESERSRAHERFAKVKKAYEILRNPEKRRDYDSGVRDYG